MATPKEYQALPGRGTRFEGARWVAGIRKSCRLWLGKDHILMLLITGYEEEIKRFYFSDVQAITVRRTLVGRVNNVVLLSFAGLCGIAASSTSGGFAAFWVIIASIFGLFAIINTWQGPTCITELKTAVQVEELSSLNRVRTAERHCRYSARTWKQPKAP